LTGRLLAWYGISTSLLGKFPESPSLAAIRASLPQFSWADGGEARLWRSAGTSSCFPSPSPSQVDLAMSTFINVGDVVECKFFCTLKAQKSINVLHFKCDSKTLVGVTDKEFANTVSALAGPLYRAWLPAVATYDGVHCQVINPTPAPWVFAVDGAGVGDVAADPLPSQAAIVMRKRTVAITEGARGLIYLPFWSEDDCGPDGKPVAGAIVKANDFATALLLTNVPVVGALGTATMAPVLWSRKFSSSRVMLEVIATGAFATHKSRSQINKGDSFAV